MMSVCLHLDHDPRKEEKKKKKHQRHLEFVMIPGDPNEEDFSPP